MQKSNTWVSLGSLLWIPTENSVVFWGTYNDQYAIYLLKFLLSSTYWKVTDLHVKILPDGLTVILEFLLANFKGEAYEVF